VSISPSPYPLPLRLRGYRKNIPSKGRRYIELIFPLKGEDTRIEIA